MRYKIAMNLKDWLKAERKAGNDVTLVKVAEFASISPANLSRACNGLSVPNLRVVQRIDELTQGKVGLHDWETNTTG